MGEIKKIVIATKNKGKVRELQEAFKDLPVELISLGELEGSFPDAVEDGTTFKENALKKAMHYQNLTKMACMADDSGLEVEALNGAPGVYSARFAGENATDADNNKKLLAELAKQDLDKSYAAYKCTLCYVDMDGTMLLAEGSCSGEIRNVPKGNNGFGYDPYFYSGDKTMAEMTLEEKQAISHRGEAIRKLGELLAKHLQ